ncbi:MAG: hypothetical protein AWU54_765 [Candidatus Frackibacter sp. T328-2]|nr:MAG: hypothetical protein AWU54_765 [Candidatus Frackibacter sp. T328-2]
MTFLIYSFLVAILGIILYHFFWEPEGKSSTQEAKETLNEEEIFQEMPQQTKTKSNLKFNTKRKNKEFKEGNNKLAVDWEVAEDLSTNLNRNTPTIESITPNMEFFSTHDYPELADYDLNTNFNQNRVTALVRDSYWVYLYWEINQLFEIDGQPILKVLDITNKNYPHCDANSFFTVDINLEATNWYLKVPSANCQYTVELGIQKPSGEFNLIARSNYFRTPRNQPSDKYDPEWMTIDGIFQRSYQADGTFNAGSSPLGGEQGLGVGEYISSPLGGYVSSPLGVGEYVSSPYISSPMNDKNEDW